MLKFPVRLSLCHLLALMALAWISIPQVRAADPDESLKKKALALNDITGDDPIETKIKLLSEDAEGSKKLLAVAVKMTKEPKQPFNYNAALILALTAHELKDLDAGQLFYRICAEKALKLKSGQKLAQSYGGLIDLLYENKKFEDSEKVCKELLELDGTDERLGVPKTAVLRRMIRAIAKQGKTDEALKLANNYVKSRKDDWLALEFKASVLREVGKIEEAAKTYEDVLERIAKDNTLEKDIRSEFSEKCHYILSGVYIDLNNVDKAADHLKTILALKPDDPTYNNDLGYIWADHNMNLDEAEKMIRKAIEEDRKQRKASADLRPEDDKDNAAYLDSLGWVLFKQKKYKEAKEPLLKAIQDKEGKHAEIYDHLAEVQMALGEKDEAIASWKKAVEVADASTSKREADRKAKVEEKLKKYEK